MLAACQEQGDKKILTQDDKSHTKEQIPNFANNLLKRDKTVKVSPLYYPIKAAIYTIMFGTKVR